MFLNKYRKKIILFKEDNPEISIAIIAAIILLIVSFVFIKFIEFDSGLSQNLYAALLGSFLDVLLFGILIVLINKRREKKLDIKRWQEEIDDYRHWNEKEATNRIVGIIKRLNKNNITNIDLSFCYLIEAKLGKDFQAIVDKVEAKLSLDMIWERMQAKLLRIPNSVLEREFIAVLSGAVLTKAVLTNANLNLVNFQNAILYRTQLQGAYMFYTNFRNANLRGANLSYSSLGGAILEGANLMDSDLRGARSLSIDQLSNVKTLFNAKLDPKLERLVKEKYPQLQENPKGETGIEGSKAPSA